MAVRTRLTARGGEEPERDELRSLRRGVEEEAERRDPAERAPVDPSATDRGPREREEDERGERVAKAGEDEGREVRIAQADLDEDPGRRPRARSRASSAHDIRALLLSFAQLSGEVRTTSSGVIIALDAPDIPAHRRALRGLCADLDQLGVTFPGADLPVTYEVEVHHSEQAA